MKPSSTESTTVSSVSTRWTNFAPRTASAGVANALAPVDSSACASTSEIKSKRYETCHHSSLPLLFPQFYSRRSHCCHAYENHAQNQLQEDLFQELRLAAPWEEFARKTSCLHFAQSRRNFFPIKVEKVVDAKVRKGDALKHTRWRMEREHTRKFCL